MGEAKLNQVVVDSGPIIHLSEIEVLPLMQIFDAIHLPDAVWIETVERGRVSSSAMSGLSNLQRHALPSEDVAQFVRENDLEKLQAGECECLCLCKNLKVVTLLTDDLAARDAAKRLGITPVGSLGVIVRAYRDGRISLEEAERCILALDSISTLFVTKAIVELAIGELKKN